MDVYFCMIQCKTPAKKQKVENFTIDSRGDAKTIYICSNNNSNKLKITYV